MTEYTSRKLKQEFLNYFRNKNHKIIKSSPVVPQNDPSLLFTNSGMVQFKNILMGQETDLKRACSIQKCIRAGGKHNDLDDVGKDTYHHTYFEMLGNWSFGNYFKKEAIEFAWDFLVNILKLKSDRLYVTYYKEMDDESFEIWKKYLPESRIIEASKEDNFWEMGDTGPCGPCTEIHYDRIGGRDASSLVNKDDPDVLEIWNIVFIEFNRTPKSLDPLERKCIDTGIGFERLLSILNDVRSNYLTDCFLPIINKIEEFSNIKYKDEFNIEDIAIRVISDHCRTISVCLIDGVDFSNEGQGYVLRRILRRAVRYAHDILKLKRGDLGKLVREFINDQLTNEMINEVKIHDEQTLNETNFEQTSNETNFDEIKDEQINFENLVNLEEDKFLETLQRGLERFNKMCKESKTISSEEIFKLYDTYGFPTDLVRILAEEKNVKLDFSNFEECKNKARNLSKKINEEISEIIISDLNKTDDKDKYTQNGICSKLQFYTKNKEIFRINYKLENSESNLSEISNILENNSLIFNIPENMKIGLCFERTCFYSESGGQIGDTGFITFYKENQEIGKFKVEDCKKINGFVLHFGILKGKASNSAILEYDDRSDLERNHTGTHLFNYFIRQEIDTVQKGSLVTKNKFRFDFEGQKMKNLQDIENKINNFINNSVPVNIKYIKKSELKKEENLIYMKNEEYPDILRVICINNIKELCGGTHVKNTKEIYKLKIISEKSISNNVRRVIGITGEEVKKAEEKIKEIRNKIRKGQVIKIDKDLPLFEREELEKENKKNIEIINKKKKGNFIKNQNNLKMVKIIYKINRKLSMTHNDVISNIKMTYEYQVIEEENKKDLLKNLINLTKIFEEEDEFLIWCKFEDFFYGFVRQGNMEDIKKQEGKFIMNNGILQFSIPGDKNIPRIFNKEL
ncbi:alanine-tRNA ligase (AARS1) [Vairimorpha necatrix]|uniref:Alanine--tRNA ligase n=1 Tax=Vairimorpha necatrix TaxID=6039 RepID=A0AAX4J8L1_9MICR